MTIYHEKRPAFQAAQFTGPSSVSEIMNLCNLRRRNFRLEGENTRMLLTVCTELENGVLETFELRDKDWLVLDQQGVRTALSAEDFSARYELAAPTPTKIARGLIDNIYGGKSPGVAPSPLHDYVGDMEQRDAIARSLNGIRAVGITKL